MLGEAWYREANGEFRIADSGPRIPLKASFWFAACDICEMLNQARGDGRPACDCQSGVGQNAGTDE